jgi:hypothetical protein
MKIIVSLLCALMPLHAWALGGLAELQVYDRTEGRRLQVYWHEGRAYVAGRPGNEYQVALRNRGGAEVLAVVSVDGVNVITGETASPSQSGYVLAPGRALEIRGWRKNMAETAAFYFTALPDSYAARTARPEHVGVIGVALFRRKAPPQEIAPLARSQAGAAADAAGAPRAAEAEERVGTGHGRREESHARYVGFERASSAPAEVLTL